MSKHKLIMENWRKFLIESDRGYRTTTPDGDDVYLYHEKSGPTDKNQRLTLYTIDPDVFGGEQLDLELLTKAQKDIGSIFLLPTRGPCIPETYQVGAVHTAPEFDRQGYGTLLYDLAFLVAADRGWGLTSDRDTGTKTTASGIWANITANDAKYEKRKTRVVDLEDPKFTDEQNDMLKRALGAPEGVTKVGGNSRFDYNQRTLDPDDDCRKAAYGGKNAANHSFALRDTTEIKAAYDKMASAHKALMELLNEQDPSTEDELEDGNTLGRNAQAITSVITDRTSDNFGDRYSGADE